MKYKLGLSITALVAFGMLMGAITDHSVAKYDAEVKIAEINANQKRKEEAKNKKGNNKK